MSASGAASPAVPTAQPWSYQHIGLFLAFHKFALGIDEAVAKTSREMVPHRSESRIREFASTNRAQLRQLLLLIRQEALSLMPRAGEGNKELRARISDPAGGFDEATGKYMVAAFVRLVTREKNREKAKQRKLADFLETSIAHHEGVMKDMDEQKLLEHLEGSLQPSSYPVTDEQAQNMELGRLLDDEKD